MHGWSIFSFSWRKYHELPLNNVVSVQCGCGYRVRKELEKKPCKNKRAMLKVTGHTHAHTPTHGRVNHKELYFLFSHTSSSSSSSSSHCRTRKSIIDWVLHNKKRGGELLLVNLTQLGRGGEGRDIAIVQKKLSLCCRLYAVVPTYKKILKVVTFFGQGKSKRFFL